MVLGFLLLAGGVSDLVTDGVLDPLVGLEPDLRVTSHLAPQTAGACPHWSPVAGPSEGHGVLTAGTVLQGEGGPPPADVTRLALDVLIQLVQVGAGHGPVQLVLRELLLTDVSSGSAVAGSEQRGVKHCEEDLSNSLAKHLLPGKLLHVLHVSEQNFGLLRLLLSPEVPALLHQLSLLGPPLFLHLPPLHPVLVAQTVAVQPVVSPQDPVCAKTTKLFFVLLATDHCLRRFNETFKTF